MPGPSYTEVWFVTTLGGQPVVATVTRPGGLDSMFAELLADDVVVDPETEERAQMDLKQIASDLMRTWARLDTARVEEAWPELSDEDVEAVVDISNHATIDLDLPRGRI